MARKETSTNLQQVVNYFLEEKHHEWSDSYAVPIMTRYPMLRPMQALSPS